MATNIVQEGKVLNWTNATGSAVVSGQMVRIGTLLGVAITDIANGATGDVQVAAVWRLPKVTATVIAVGAAVDFVAATGLIDTGITPAAGDLQNCGTATAAAGNGDTTVDVLLNMGYGTPA